MAACDDKLLEEDGDYEDYEELGEGDEEALLREDDLDEFGHDQGEGEEPEGEDVLELEAGQDDLDAEIQDGLYEQDEAIVQHSSYSQSVPSVHMNRDAEEALNHDYHQSQDNAYQEDEIPQRDLPDDEEEEEDEMEGEGTRGRFRSERNSSVPLKSNSQSYNDIPDTLDEVIPDGNERQMQGISRIERGGHWGRGRGGRGASRGNVSNFRGGATNRGQVRGGRGMPHSMGRNERANYHNQGSRPHGPNGPPPVHNRNMQRNFPQNFGPGQNPQMQRPPNIRSNMGSNMGHNMGHNMPIVSNMGPHMGTNMRPNMLPQVHPNINPHMHSNMGPQMHSNMGPQMHSNMGPQMHSNMGPQMHSNMGMHPNMGPPMHGNMGPPMHSNMGLHMGNQMGSNMMSHVPPHMPPQMGQNVGPHMTSQMPPNMINIVPNMSQNVVSHGPPQMGHNNMAPNMGPPMQKEFVYRGQPNMPPPNNGPLFSGHNSMAPNYNPNIGIAAQHGSHGGPPVQAYRSSNFTFGVNSNQNDQYSPIQRVIYNTSQNQGESTIIRVAPEDTALRPNQVTNTIHVNPHFRGNLSSEGRPIWENHENTQYQGHPGHFPASNQGNLTNHPDTNFNSGPEWNPNSANVNQRSQVPFQPEKPPQQRFTAPPGRGGLKGQSPGASGINNRKQQYTPPKRSQTSSPGVIPRKQVRLEPKHGKTLSSNLHEVQTVDTLPVSIDTLPDTTTTNESHQDDPFEDEETREYRKKIEAQKRLREKLLREKEERRMKAALQKQSSPSTSGNSTENIKGHAAKDTKITNDVQSISTIVNRNPFNPANSIQVSPRKPPVMKLQFPSNTQSVTQESPSSRGRGMGRGRGRGVSLPGRGAIVPVQNRLGRGGRIVSATSTSPAPTPASSSEAAVSNVTGSNPQAQRGGGRIVVMRGRGAHHQPVIGVQRVIKPPQETRTAVEPNSISNQGESNISSAKIVSVENLANSTNETQLRAMCSCIGRVENIKLDKGNKRAVIYFAAAESASIFVKRYQRKMVDLSLIKVSLVD